MFRKYDLRKNHYFYHIKMIQVQKQKKLSFSISKILEDSSAVATNLSRVESNDQEDSRLHMTIEEPGYVKIINLKAGTLSLKITKKKY